MSAQRSALSPSRYSLFRRTSRYRPSSVDPHENRLTEIFAAVLERRECDGLARHLVRGWLADSDVRPESALGELLGDSETRWMVAVETQHGFFDGASRWRPDLRLTFTRCDSRTKCAIWVEVKQGAPLGPRQLFAYTERLREHWGENGCVVLLAPRSQYPFDKGQVPGDVVQVTWEDAGEMLRQYPTDDAVAYFLVEQLIAYLDEQGLMDPAKLTAVHLDALKNYEAGRHALERICERAAEKVGASWAGAEAEGSYPPPGAPRGLWWNYPQQALDGDTVEAAGDFLPSWELLFSGRDLLPECPAGVPVFIAGISGEQGRALSLDAGVRVALETSGFEIWPYDSLTDTEHNYVICVRPVDDLLKAGRIDEQAEKLAEWVNKAFRDIVRALNTA